MDINDFQGLFKFKLVIPALYLISWAMMFTGPYFFSVAYQTISFGFLVYLAIKVSIMFFIAIMAFFRTQKVLNRVEEAQSSGSFHSRIPDPDKQIIHAFIVPSYKEDIDLLAETLEWIARHHEAKQSTMVFLAMEAHEEHSDQKAKTLIARFSHQFRYMNYTRHQIREFEQKGKASNVSWCAEHLQQFFQSQMINEDNVILTIIDADSWVPPVYLDEVNEHLQNNYENRHRFIYAPPQIFTRNQYDVPVFSRICDLMHGCVHHSNIMSSIDCSFPLSNYSLSYKLIKRIGFWDTCADAIGEDFHTTQKAFWKTHGEVESVPIFTMFNQVNLHTGKGYWPDIQARFWQAERHARGIIDAAYSMKMILSQPLNARCLIMAYQVIETGVLPATLPWIFIANAIQSRVLWYFIKPSPEMISQDYINFLFFLIGAINTTAYFMYYLLARRSTTILYGLENGSWWRLLEYPIIFPISMFCINLAGFVIASFGSLIDGREYTVAEKVMEKKKDQHHH